MYTADTRYKILLYCKTKVVYFISQISKYFLNNTHYLIQPKFLNINKKISLN